jgi:hypothetical protein
MSTIHFDASDTLCLIHDILSLKVQVEELAMNDVESGAEQHPQGGSTRHLAHIPRWVKVFVVVAATVLLLMVVAMLITGGQHGPGRHLSASPMHGRTAASASATDTNLGGVC